MKKSKNVNYRVVITCGRHSDNEAEARIILREVKRHIGFGGDVCVEWDTETTCEFCHEIWEEYGDGSPMCCDKAVAEWELANTNAVKETP